MKLNNILIIVILLIIIFFTGIGTVYVEIKDLTCAAEAPENDPCKPPYLTTTSPLVFGPILWPALHVIGASYHTPNGTDIDGEALEIYRVNARKFIESLPFMLPCGHCGFHLHEFLQTQNLDEATRTKANFFKFFVDAHNNVTEHVNTIKINGKLLPPKKLWTVEEAREKYFCKDITVKDPRLWETTDLLTDISQNPQKYLKDMIPC